MTWYIRIINYFYNCYLSGWHFLPVSKLLRIIKKNNIDIVHTNTIMEIDAAFAAKLIDIPHVWHIREGIGYDLNAVIKFPFQKYPRIFRWAMDRLSSKIITNSKYTASLAKQYFPKDKLEVIYNSLPDEWFVKKINQDTKSKFIIGTVANVTSRWKNHSLVIEVANVIINKYTDLNVIFHIFGELPNGDNPYYSGLKKRIKILQLTDTVIFMGRKKAEELYDNIDILFHTYDKEGFGRIFIEAMGKCVPVVAVKGGGADELIEDGITGYKVAKDKPEHIADRIIELITNKETYNKISQNGFKYSSVNFKSSLMWEKISYIYNNQLVQ
jgi:glycosyltransferase involved in cell wall biosynthesis